MSKEQDNKLHLQIGDTLQLQFVADEKSRRLYSKVIGYLQGQSVLITTPRLDGNVMLVRPDQVVIVRMMTGNQVYGFTTQVLCSNLKPYSYLHLAYPKEMEHITVRKSQRINTCLIANIEIESETEKKRISRPALILDISTTGAMIEVDNPIGEVGDIIQLSAKVKVAEIEEYINIDCMIRNVIYKEDGKKYRHGLEFKMLENKQHFVLHGYVYEQMIQNMKNN